MSFYTGFLRALIHLAGLLIVISAVIIGYQSWQILGGMLGLLAGAILAGSINGYIALQFEIRDTLMDIREKLSGGSSLSNSMRREPSL